MEFVAKQSALLRELSLVQGIVEKKNTVPVLANVLLTASAESVNVMATDLEVSVRSSLTAEIRREGALSVSARKLHEIVRALPEADVRFKADGENWATITCQQARFRIMGLPREDFPNLPSPGKDDKVTFSIQQFKEMIHKVIFAVATDDARYALNGALMILDAGSVSLVSSDSHRLACVRRPLVGKGPSVEVRVVIPQKALGELSRIAEEVGGEIVFSRHENQIFFEMGRCTLASRLLEGQFPSYEKVLPAGNDKKVDLGRTAFGDAVRRVSLVANERSKAVRLALSKGTLEVSAKNPELGEASESLEVDYSGGDVVIGFNARYLLDFVNVTQSDRILFELKDEATQGLMKPVAAAADKKAKGSGVDKGAADGDGDYQYVIMPMRI